MVTPPPPPPRSTPSLSTLLFCLLPRTCEQVVRAENTVNTDKIVLVEYFRDFLRNTSCMQKI